MEKEEKLLEMLKAYFTTEFMGISDCTEGGCETCGHGGTEAASLEAVRDAIDRFKNSDEYLTIVKGD